MSKDRDTVLLQRGFPKRTLAFFYFVLNLGGQVHGLAAADDVLQALAICGADGHCSFVPILGKGWPHGTGFEARRRLVQTVPMPVGVVVAQLNATVRAYG